ncbi:hypothetical protein KP509_12G096000 [Ceratopteris richardii]|uniref:EF-hand domain-containing protein n=1 Tax=Ceratopteris richardii TaxID=49495 RepID=A0A8T2TLL0_CERRI|nr:hypothetical protein KP509_12G096000 [Ceratopteris richardii]KAH7424228.1 hypothetical protein KP509_12G096000 [Ceratopteris richardii]
MDQWNYGSRGSQQGHPPGQLGYPPSSYGSQQGASVPTSYGSQLFSQPNFGQTYGQQILGAGGKSTGPDDYQGVSVGPTGIGGNTSISMSGLYGLESKFPSSGFGGGGGVGASPAPFNQKSEQISALGQYSKSQSQYLGAADTHSDPLKQFSESQTALRQGTSLDAGARSQSEYLSSGRSSAISAGGGGAYGSGRELLGSSYGLTRSEAEAALLGSQVGLTTRGMLPFQSHTSDSLGPLAGGRGLLGAMYPLGTGYGSLDLASARGSINGMSDLAGIGSARYSDRLDDRMALRYEFERRDDDRRIRERSRERDRERERERDRSWERERERERERLRERERMREREWLRERERAREREREREKEQRRRERTPPRPLPPPRREDKVGKKFSPPPVRLSPPHKLSKREYVCKVESSSLLERERDLLSLIRRYPRLYISEDFSKVVTCWNGGDYEIPLNQPVSFELDAVDAEEDPTAKDSTTNSMDGMEKVKENIVWIAKVMLMSGATGESMKDLIDDSSSEEKPVHLHNFLRFVVFRKDRSALSAVGGAWDKVLDGGDPTNDESCLIHTAIRCVKDCIQLDLSGVSSWKRFMEVHYNRVRDNGSMYKEIAVYFIPDISACLPTLEDWKLQWRERRDAKLKQEASQKHEKDGKIGGSPKDAHNKERSEKQDDTDARKEDLKKEEKLDKALKKDDLKDKVIKEDKKDTKKDLNKDKEMRSEEKKEIKKDDKKGKDTKKDDKKKEGKHEEKEKDVKKDDRKQKERKAEKLGKEDKRDEEKSMKDSKSLKSRVPDKKEKSLDFEAPEIPGFFLVASRTKNAKHARVMTISLDGLLDYDERDKEESTFELSLFAEVFQEMLQHRFGSHILGTLESLHRAFLVRKKDEKKRSRHDKDVKPAAKKKSKFSNSPVKSENAQEKVVEKEVLQTTEEEEKPKPVKDIDAAMQEASLINFDELEEELQENNDGLDASSAGGNEAAEDSKERKKSLQVDEELMKAFRYFDRNRLNYLKAEDLRRLVHILGKCLTRKWVKDLTATALNESRSKDDCLYYRSLAEKEIL